MKTTLFILGLLAPLLAQPGGFAQESCRASFERMKRVGIEFDQAQKKANDLITAKATKGEAYPVTIKQQSHYDKYKKNLESAAANRKDSARNCTGHYGRTGEKPSRD